MWSICGHDGYAHDTLLLWRASYSGISGSPGATNTYLLAGLECTDYYLAWNRYR